MDFCSKSKFTNSSVLHSHKELMKKCPHGKYRQLKLFYSLVIRYHNRILFNRSVIKDFSYLRVI